MEYNLAAMLLRLGDTAPDFTAQTTTGEVHFHSWLDNSWAVLFSHPKNFTPVCTTELGAAARIKGEFERRGVKLIGLSVDSVEDHHKWQQDILETQGHAPDFPLIGDPDARVAELYGMIHPQANDTLTVRAVYIIDPQKKIRLTFTYPASTGRNFTEILRVLDALMLVDKHKVSTPANWNDGDDVIIAPSLSDAEARERFPQGWDEQKPYLRVIRQPK